MSNTPRLQLLGVAAAAELLRVDRSVVERWVADERIPYLTESGAGPRIPLQGLLAAIRDDPRLRSEVRAPSLVGASGAPHPEVPWLSAVRSRLPVPLHSMRLA